MKSKLLIFSSFLLIGFFQSQIVNIPDANFKSYLVNNSEINTNADSEIQVSEAASFTGAINCNNRNISDLTGIETFTNITSINVGFNQLTSLNVSNNTALIGLYCFGNQITSLNVSNNTALQNLLCFNNQISSLNVSNNLALNTLSCFSNQLTSLDVTKNTALVSLNCLGNQISSLDVSKNTLLQNLSCDNNLLTSLDVTNNTALVGLSCYGNQITSLDVTKNLSLQTLDCYFNKIASLDVSKNTALTYLHCGRNFITSLNIANNLLLQDFSGVGDQIGTLDVSKNTALTSLDCRSCGLTSLDVSKNTALTFLLCYANSLKKLNLKNGNNANMTTMQAFSNSQLTCIEVDDVTLANSLAAAYTWQVDYIASFSTNCGYLSTDNNAQNSVKIYPNPTKNLVNFTMVADAEIYNSLGQKILEKKQTSAIDLSKLENGVYQIILFDKNGKEISRSKVIKK